MSRIAVDMGRGGESQKKKLRAIIGEYHKTVTVSGIRPLDEDQYRLSVRIQKEEMGPTIRGLRGTATWKERKPRFILWFFYTPTFIRYGVGPR